MPIYNIKLMEKSMKEIRLCAFADEASASLEGQIKALNKNAIPWDPEKPAITSGVRIGTPAVTTRGFKEEDCALVAELIVDIIKNREEAFDRVRTEVKKLTEKYPIYKGLVR